MSSAWLLPEHIADVLPAQAALIEALRRRLIDQAQSRGFELVIPPLLEHLESLLTGTGSELDLQTFKLVDQLSGRLLGLRADTTAQAARIDAHLLNREGVTRLCYCGPVLRTVPAGVDDSREPLQFGAEVFGHAGLEADLEVLELALDVLLPSKSSSGAVASGPLSPGVVIDLADARILSSVLGDDASDRTALKDIVPALARKDPAALHEAVRRLPSAAAQGLHALLDLHGGDAVLEEAARRLPSTDLLQRALEDLAHLSRQLSRWYPEIGIGFDLADMGGYAYYSGVRFSLYASGCSQALIRGGRYDEVGSVFGRKRPAVGFSLDVKSLASQVVEVGPLPAVRAPWGEDAALKAAIRRLREAGETVVVDLPGSSSEECGRDFDRELICVGGRWVLQSV